MPVSIRKSRRIIRPFRAVAVRGPNADPFALVLTA
jgi:hypothetical protein